MGVRRSVHHDVRHPYLPAADEVRGREQGSAERLAEGHEQGPGLAALCRQQAYGGQDPQFDLRPVQQGHVALGLLPRACPAAAFHQRRYARGQHRPPVERGDAQHGELPRWHRGDRGLRDESYFLQQRQYLRAVQARVRGDLAAVQDQGRRHLDGGELRRSQLERLGHRRQLFQQQHRHGQQVAVHPAYGLQLR